MKFLPLLVLPLLTISCTQSDLSSAPISPPAAGPLEFSAAENSSPTRHIRQRGSMFIKSRNLEKSSNTCVALVASHQGTLENARLTEDRYHATIRVPSPALKPLMTSLSEVGKVTNKSVSAEDVTSEYTDLEALLKNKRALRDRLRLLLNKAETVKDTLEIEKQLTKVQTELDQLESRMKTLRNQVALSTLEVDINRQKTPGPLGAAAKGGGWILKKLFVLN